MCFLYFEVESLYLEGDAGFVPVISPIGTDKDENTYNINGGMIPKTECCIDALDKGVKSVHVLNGRVPLSILLEIFTEDGIGTMLSC